MSLFWIFLWAVISAAILGTFFWSTIILHQQKRAWKAFTTAHKLNYEPGKFFESPKVSGIFEGRFINLFSQEKEAPGGRSTIYRTALEVTLGRGIGSEGGMIANREGQYIIDMIDYPHKLVMPDANAAGLNVSAYDEAFMRDYLTNARLDILKSMMKLRDAGIILAFGDREALLRLELPDPLHMPGKAEQLMRTTLKTFNRLIDGLDIKETSPAEAEEVVHSPDKEEKD